MPPVIPSHIGEAKRRMKQGLHPAVLAAVARSVDAAKSRPADATSLPNDPATIRRFQQFHGVPATGRVDAATQAAMGRVRTTLAPSQGAGQQAYLGAATNRGALRATPLRRGGLGSRIDPLANQAYQRYMQRDPEGGLREVHVYGTGANRQVRAFTPTDVAPSVLQQLSNTATAEDKMIALAHRAAAAGKLAQPPGSRRRFSSKPGLMQRY